jgi:hypothetical protein
MADKEKEEFRTTGGSMNYRELLQLRALQKQAHDKLLAHPEEFLETLTVGYLKMLDQAYLDEESKEDGGRARALRKDAFVGHNRAGKVTLWPTEKHNIGKWGGPDLGFDGFRLYSEGLNKATEETLLNISPQALPVTVAFNFLANNPFSGFWHPDKIIVSFVRDSDGRFFVEEDTITDDVREWLASYYTRLDREHTSDELDTYAPLGAEKLYQAVKRKLIIAVE